MHGPLILDWGEFSPVHIPSDLICCIGACIQTSASAPAFLSCLSVVITLFLIILLEFKQGSCGLGKLPPSPQNRLYHNSW